LRLVPRFDYPIPHSPHPPALHSLPTRRSSDLFQPVLYRLSIAGWAAIPWGYLYRGGSVQPYVSPPIVDWWNSHLSAERDKVWVDPLYTSYHLYSKPEIFNGESYDSPSYLGEWRLTDSRALQHLRAEH